MDEDGKSGSAPLEDDGEIFVSDGILGDGSFGVYLKDNTNPALEYRLIGGLSSVSEARARAEETFGNLPEFTSVAFDEEGLPLHTRAPLVLPAEIRAMKPAALADSVKAEVNRWSAQLSKKKIIKGFLSARYVLGWLPLIAIILFWTDGSVGVPKGWDLPLVGDSLGETQITALLLARWYPFVLFALYAAHFLRSRQISLGYDLLRKQILGLVLLHGWRLPEFARLIGGEQTKGDMGWFTNALSGLYEYHSGSVAGIRKQAEEAGEAREARAPSPEAGTSESGSVNVAEELDQKLQEWIPQEFERRVHHLFFLDKEKDYNRALMSFHPLLYLISSNRVRFRAYGFLRDKGVQLDEINAPKDPYLIERAPLLAFWLAHGLAAIIQGAALVWSFRLAMEPWNLFLVAKLISAVVVLLLPIWWNYGVLIKKRGFPKFETIGAYTVGPVPNEMLLI